MERGEPVIRVEDEVTPEHLLLAKLKGFVKKTSRTQLLLQADGKVPHRVTVAIQDAAKGAGMDRVRLLLP
jgi:biopolymer transport protein ExbD